jgi:hypothetical protein
MGLETRVHLSRWAVLECLGRKCGGFASLNICLPSLPGHVMPVTVYPHLVGVFVRALSPQANESYRAET